MAYLSTEQLDSLIRTYFQEALNKAYEIAIDLRDDPRADIPGEVAGSRLKETSLRLDFSRHHFDDAINNDAQDLIRRCAHPGAQVRFDDMVHLQAGLLRAQIEQHRYLIAELTGDTASLAPADPLFSGIKPRVPTEPYDAREPSFKEAIDLFMKAKAAAWVKKTKADHERVFGWAMDIIGPDRTLISITTADVRDFRDALGAMPKNFSKYKAYQNMSLREVFEQDHSLDTIIPRTQKKYFELFQSLLKWCFNEERIPKRPGVGLKIEGVSYRSDDTRRSYDVEQLSRIFSSPVFTGMKSATRRALPGDVLKKDAYYWIPIIALLTGMRLGEIIQLEMKDATTRAGIPYFDVNDFGDEDKTVKTTSSRRKVPIPALLIDLGFEGYLQQRRQTKDRRIFEEIKAGEDGYYSHNFSKWWTRYTRAIGAYTPETTFHSFRHCFKDALVNAVTSDTMNMALLGHDNPTTYGRYGVKPSLGVLKRVIDSAAHELDLKVTLEKQLPSN